jgi:hypothetical protein
MSKENDLITVHLHVERIGNGALPLPERLTVLRGQLALLRMRAEQGIPVSVESIARAERLARGLEAEELAA